MKKRIVILATVVVVVFFLITWLANGGGGNTSDCERIIGSSVKFSDEEITEAMDLVEHTFASQFKGCYLIKLTYEEALSDLYSEDLAIQYGSEIAMVLTSMFVVGDHPEDESLNPNSTYSNWQWILTRSGQEDWVLRSWGY